MLPKLGRKTKEIEGRSFVKILIRKFIKQSRTTNPRRLTSGRLTTDILFLNPFHEFCCVLTLCRMLNKFKDKLMRSGSGHSIRSSSSRASADMQIDIPPPVVGAPPQSSIVERNIMLEEKHLK